MKWTKIIIFAHQKRKLPVKMTGLTGPSYHVHPKNREIMMYTVQKFGEMWKKIWNSPDELPKITFYWVVGNVMDFHQQGPTFLSCSVVELFIFVFGFKFQPTFNIMESGQECTQETRSAFLVSSSICGERHLVRPFSKHETGVVTTIRQVLTLVRINDGGSPPSGKLTNFIFLCLKVHWTSITSSPNFFQKKVGIFIISSVGMGDDCMLSLRF